MIVILACTPAAWADTWLHVTGRSWHDRSGYNGINPGLGIEIQTHQSWSVAGGLYHNSVYRTTVYALGKYHWLDHDGWKINVIMGAATGYGLHPAAPIIMPELCRGWVCVFAAPRLGPDTTAAAAFYLRIPIGQPGS